ncbi:gamma-tubulin complex component 3 [Dorcoceras hygrometricum]|uniref:Gamma-tubulin complex component 3 n=1 Tax=Dorcoceras hygrometricum TaxID=472368 RepID=A0A2Z7BUG4_9LAMI|nr:gamma-tubulin complex component 3 [Dorcoceras hygrometricum]
MEDDERRVVDLVKELVHRLLFNPQTPVSSSIPTQEEYNQALKYSLRILSSRMKPSIAADEFSVVESIKRRLATTGKSSEALTFADLYSKFSLRNGPGSVKNKWAVLYLLNRISEDQKLKKNRFSDKISSGFLDSVLSGGLPALHDSDALSDRPGSLGRSNLIKEENEVSEEALVRDVLYACQGIDGAYLKFDEKADEYVLPDFIKVPRATRTMVRKLCELGWLFRKVKGYVTDSMDRFPAEDIGTVGQAFCAALQDELSVYYKLLVVLEGQSMNPIPLVSENACSGNYLSLRRLSVWFAEPMVKMGLMAVLVDSCKVLKGYRLLDAMLPSFISQSLAQRILRTGKSINFLRVCCEDRVWADAAKEAAAAAGTTTRRGDLGYGETDALESLVAEAAKRIDKHLLDVMYTRYKFKEHCLAIKRYLLLGQGDFVQYLMDIVGPELSEPANTISSFKLAGLLESAIASSNAQYDDRDMLDRLRVKMMPHNTGDRGWDVFSLDYDARVPLNTVFTESVMSRYLRIFNFLWKLRRIEHALIGVWKGMKPNRVTSQFFSKLPRAVTLQLILTSRKCQVLWDEMNHFVTNLQYYIMFEVLEVSWSNFSKEMEVAKDLDDLLGAHEKYLHSIIEKSLLGERSENLNKTLFTLFDLILRFRSHADRLYEGINELQSRATESSRPYRDKAKLQKQPSNRSSESSSWLGEGRKELTRRAGEFLRNMGQAVDATSQEYSSLFEGFISQLPIQQHVDLKFLMFRLDFTEFYSQLKSTAGGKILL